MTRRLPGRLVDDLRHAWRSVWRRPGFLLIGALALGLGLGATALVFALVNTFVLRPVSGIAPQAPLVEIGRLSGERFDSFSLPDVAELRAQSHTLDRVFAFRAATAYLQSGSETRTASALLVSGDYFESLGVAAWRGQMIGRQHDTAEGGSAVVVASYRAFEQLLGARAEAIGSPLRINGHRYVLIGVADPAFHGHDAFSRADFYVPLAMHQSMNVAPRAARDDRGARWLRVGGRVAPDYTLAEVRSELGTISTRLAAAYPASNRDVRFDADAHGPAPREARRIVAVMAAALLALCLAVLLLACFNLAGVMLARGQVRRAELAVRVVLGAGPGRVLRQLWCEALLVGLAAAFCGLLLAWLSRGILHALPLPDLAGFDLALTLDARVAAAIILLAVAVATVFGLWPAWRMSGHVPGRDAALSEAGGRVASSRVRLLLVGVQALLTVSLLLFAAMLLRASERASTLDAGFRLQQVWLAGVDVRPLGISVPDAAQRLERVAATLRATPGVEAAGFASVVPLTLESAGMGAARLGGSQGEGVSLDVNTVGSGWLETLEVPVRGRTFQASDREGTQRVAIINQTLAGRLFGEGDAIGRSFELGAGEEWQSVQVIGVASDSRYRSPGDEGTSFAYLPAAQWDRGDFTLFVRSPLTAEALRERVQAATEDQIPGLPPPQIESFERRAQLSVLPQLVLGSTASVLGSLALLLSATGIYGVLAYQVAMRTREFGVRMALGAPGRRIAARLARSLMLWLLPAVLIGLVLGQALGSSAGTMLFGVGGFDPGLHLAVLCAFSCVAAVAAGWPLLRTLRLPPSAALRQD